MLRPFHVHGGVIINASEGVVLSDYLGIAADQNLVDQVITDTATLFITLDTKCKYFFLESVTVGYTQAPEADDLAELFLLEGPEADDILQRAKARWSDEDGIAEAATPVETAANKSFMLDTSGILYFMTNWTTAVLDAGAGEYFFLRVDGYTFHRN